MKKVLLTALMCMIMCCMLALGTSAATAVTDDGTNVTLGDCTIEGLDGVTIPSPTRGLDYSLDDTAMTATVTGKGSFTGGELVFPSSVTYDGKTYTVTKIASGTFKSMTYDLYVPDSVTFIGGGSGIGAFGGSTIAKVYIGSGLTSFERELFSGSHGYTHFVCKSKLTSIGVYAFNENYNANGAKLEEFELDLTSVVRIEDYAFPANRSGTSLLSGQSIEFGDCLEYVGNSAFMSTRVKGNIVIPENCTLSYRSFNGTDLDQVVIKVPKNGTRALPEELFSGSYGPMTVVIDGDATAEANYVFSMYEMTVYMPTKAQIQTLVTGASAKSGNERIEKVTFISCEDSLSFTATRAGVLSEGTAATPHVYTENTVTKEANCTYVKREAYICYSCGYEDIVSQETELGMHVFETSTKAPNCQSIGYTEYACTVCGLQEVGAYVEATSHSNSVKSYKLNDDKTVTVTSSCEYCGTVGGSEAVSLVNKCYIEGYGLFDASMEYVSVNASGDLTPSSATFDNAVIYFPSYVEVDGEVVEVKTISGFKSRSIKEIYIPDTVTRIVSGSGNGCFGDNHYLTNIVIGCGVTAIERETFCMGKNVYVDEFIITGTIKDIRQWAFRNLRVNSGAPHRFVAELEYVGYQACTASNVLKEARILKGCNLSEKFAFNGAEGISKIYIEGGDTPETALDLGQEFTSNQASQYLYIKGYVTVSGQAVLADKDGLRIFMESKEAIDLFTNAIKSYSYKERINKATFMDCSTGTAYYVSSTADAVVHPSVAFYHGGIIEQAEANCIQGGTKTEKCFVCDEIVSTEETPALEHEYNGGVITKMPDCKDLGIIVYSCFGCSESHEFTIFRDYSTHDYKAFMTYVNGFDKNGEAGDKCIICEDVQGLETVSPILVAIGYSVRDPEGERNGIDGGYTINDELLIRYEALNGEIEIGIIIANASDASANGLVDELFRLVSKKGLQVELSKRGYSAFNLSIVGFDTDTLKALDLVITAYVVADLDGNGVTEISYVQYTMPEKDNGATAFGDVTLNTVSIDRAAPVASATSYSVKKDEE